MTPLITWALGAWHQLRHRLAHDERGSVTMETVIWALAVIAIAAIVVTAITAFVTNEAAKIK